MLAELESGVNIFATLVTVVLAGVVGATSSWVTMRFTMQRLVKDLSDHVANREVHVNQEALSLRLHSLEDKTEELHADVKELTRMAVRHWGEKE